MTPAQIREFRQSRQETDMPHQIYDVEFLHNGVWHFYCQEAFEFKARDWADWLRETVMVEARYTLRTVAA